jgi:carbon monoxide dehydrogenase subunit G
MTFDEMATSGTIEISAAPEAVYDLIANVLHFGEWSPECVGCNRDATGDATVGQKFTGTNKIGDFEWTTNCQVVAADPGKTFSFEVDGGMDDGAAATWAYELAPTGSGTSVTESFKIGPSAGGYRMFGKGKTQEEQDAMAAARVDVLTNSIATTLTNLKAMAEG